MLSAHGFHLRMEGADKGPTVKAAAAKAADGRPCATMNGKARAAAFVVAAGRRGAL